MTGADIPIIVQAIAIRWNELKKKYPQLYGKPMFSVKGEFASTKSSLSEIYKSNPFVFNDQPIFPDGIDSVITKLLKKTPLNPDCEIVIIFEELDYDLIAELQKDPLIDRQLTPQMRASIRIVLGTIKSFMEEAQKT